MGTRTQIWVRMISAFALLGMLLSACFLAPLPQAQAAPIANAHPCTIDPNSVYGDIGKKYSYFSGPDGVFGCPTSDEIDYAGGRTRSFEHGLMFWVPFSDHPPLLIWAYQSFAEHNILVGWEESARRDFYLLRWQQEGGQSTQSDEISDNYQIIPDIYVANSTYTFMLEGCDKTYFLGVRTGSDCYGWLPTISLKTSPDTPPPPSGPATVNQNGWTLAAVQQGTSIVFSWTNTPPYQFYQMRWTVDGRGQPQAQTASSSGIDRTSGSYSLSNVSLNSIYSLQVQGCTFKGIFHGSDCSSWVGPVYLKATNSDGGEDHPTPPPPLVHPTISFDPATAIVSGNGFLANTTVYIRVVIQGFPNGISDHRETQAPYPQTTSDGQGTIRKLVIPASSVPPYVDSTITVYGCFPGEDIYISANDGRKDPNDLTGTLWSNTAHITCPAATITAETGGSLSASGIQLDFPAHAITSATTVTFNELSAPTQPAALGDRALRSFILQGQTGTGQPVTQFQQPYTMTVGYDAAELSAKAISETSLKLAFWDTQSNRWASVPMRLDIINHQVTASLDHFTEFALFGSTHLDDFNRPNGTPGLSWSGHIEGDDYQIRDQQLHVHVGDRGTLYWQPETFGSVQEAFVTFAHLDTRTRGEDARQSVLLKVQGEIPDMSNGAIEVRYYAQRHSLRIQSRLPGQDWQVLVDIPASFADGDQLGARARADGHIQAFRNGMLIGEADAGGFFANIGGRIGLRCIDARDTMLDDFGGGNVSSLERIATSSSAKTRSVAYLPLLWR